jgi:patatin-like phospholipase/acyl hydrolase
MGSDAGLPAYRVLALDGGGLRGIFAAAALVELESALGSDFLRSFDLMVGTSTGGILALGLASGRTSLEMLRFYRDVGAEVFDHPRRIRRAIGPKYDRAPLDDLLRREFGEALRMNDLGRAVCITAHELVRGTTRVLKDDHSSELHWGGELPVWKVAAATSAAPTYFAPVQLEGADSHVDGGIWGNNPAMVGIVEAVRYARQQLSAIRLLSIGTTSSVLRVESHRTARRMGVGAWATKALQLLQGSAATAVDNQARLLLDDGHYVRLDSESTGRVALDDISACEPLEAWGRDVGRRNVGLVRRLLELPDPTASIRGAGILP